MSMKWIWIVLVVGLALVFPMNSALAGGEGSPPPAGVSGPEVWGVVIIDCTNNSASMRIKTIDNCLVETDAYTGQWAQACPSTVSQVLWFVLDGASFDMAGLGFDANSDLIITKVKNFATKIGGELVSFDAQFRQTP